MACAFYLHTLFYEAPSDTKFAYLFLLQEWPEAVYPPYANGPGYIISSNIAKYIVSQNSRQKLRV